MIADPAEKRAEHRRGDHHIAEGPRSGRGRRTEVPDHLGGRLRLVPAHRRHCRDHRNPGGRRHLCLPVLHPGLPRHGPSASDLCSRHRRQPALSRSRHPRHRPEVRQPIQSFTCPSRLSRLPESSVFPQNTPQYRLDPKTNLEIGEKVHIVPGYSDFTFVLHDRVLGIRAGRVEAVWDLLSRGRLQ